MLKDFYPMVDRIHVPLPTGDYLLLITWSLHHKITFVTNVYFTFVENF